MNQTSRLGRVAIVVVIMVIFVVYAVLTGSDPLDLIDPGHALVPPDNGWWQVYFTDPERLNDPDDLRGSIPAVLIDYIDNAQHSIHVAAFEFDLPPVAEALVDARQRGVEVRWVTDDEHGIEADEDEGLDLFAKLERAGVRVKDDGRGALMHNKFWIFDDQIVWTGSTNITANGNFRNNNNVLVMYSPVLADIYEREFDEMWAGEFGPRSPSTVYDQAAVIDGTPVQVLFGSEDEVAGRLATLVDSARSSIRFMAFSFTHDQLGDAVLDRARAGVDVKGIFERRGSKTEYSEMPILYCAGLPVRQDGNPGTLHHKVFVIDDEIVITGSFNFSNNADESNDENVVIVTNADIAARYLREFERRWAEAAAPDSGDVRCR
jgi:phosphatidylserine/phosphatidylglycerophosphate/cardiolipin synthase-like enzyme